jgi:hypothetical protein
MEIATRQDDGTYLVPSRPGRFATREAAEQAHFDHVDRMRQALGREPTQRELLHGPARHDPRDTNEKLLDAEWQPVVEAATRASNVAAEYDRYVSTAETPGEIRRSVSNFRKETLALAEQGQFDKGVWDAPQTDQIDAERQAAIEFVKKLEWESQYDASLDATHIEVLRKMRLQAARGSLSHFRDMAESWTAERDKADEARLTAYDEQIAALKATRSARARLRPLADPKTMPLADILALPVEDPERQRLLRERFKQ